MAVSNAASAVSSMDFKKCRKFHVFLVLVLVIVISCSVSYKWLISGRWQEAGRQEAERQEAERQEAGRQEAGRQEAERQEAGRQEAERQEAERQEAGRQEAERQEAGRQEAGTPKAGRQEAGTPKAVRSNVTILIWTWPYEQTSTLLKNECWDNYHISGCNLVDNRSFFSQADVVIFHNRELQNGVTKLPLDVPRPPGQKWVWYCIESPTHNGDLRSYAGLFNWTMTYQRDADIYVPYGELVPRTTKANYTIPDKKTLACWVVSNYQSGHRRTGVYMSLKDLIPVEVYGGMANKPLNPDQVLPTISQCYFYLAFENSVHRDYITEKLWYNSFLAGTVPVVLGPPRANYEAYIPKDSFIHVDDFASITELATFLNQLASDKERYNSYFRWRSDYDVKRLTSWQEYYCKACETYERLPPKFYDDLHSWSTNES